MKKLASILLLALTLGFAVPASATWFGDTDNSCKGNHNCNTTTTHTTNNKGGDGGNAKAKSRSTSKSKASARSSARSNAKGVGTGVGVSDSNSGGNSLTVNQGGDKVDAAPAQAGSIGLAVRYECGGTAGAYIGAPGFVAGGGTATVFELCEDVFVAEKALHYGIPGASDFLEAILVRRVGDFNARRADATAPASTPDN